MILSKAAALSDAKLAALDASTLAKLLADVDELAKDTRTLKGRLQAAVLLHYAAPIASARETKPFGRVRIPVDGNQTLIHEVEKVVTWNQRHLAGLVTSLPERGYDPDEMITTTRDVSERAYGAWPSSIKALFDPGRTVSAGRSGASFAGAHEGKAGTMPG